SPGLLIVLDGAAELVSSTNRRVQQGDVLTIPAGQAYGFREVSAAGLHALHVAFGDEEPGALAGEPTRLDQVLAHNEARASELLNNNPFFLMLRTGVLES